MVRRLRRLLLMGGIGAAMFILMVLTALPAAASSPYTRTGCAVGNFACLRAHHIFIGDRDRDDFRPVYAQPRYVPVYSVPQYAPAYVQPQYVNPYSMPYTQMPYTPTTYTPTTYTPGMGHCPGPGTEEQQSGESFRIAIG